MRPENEIILGEFGQCCHHCFVLSGGFVHKNGTSEHRAKVRIEHRRIGFVHASIIYTTRPIMGGAYATLSGGTRRERSIKNPAARGRLDEWHKGLCYLEGTRFVLIRDQIVRGKR